MSQRLLIAAPDGPDPSEADLVLNTALRRMRALRPGLEFVVVSFDPARIARRFGVRALAASDIPGILDAVDDAGAVVLVGGRFHEADGVVPESLLTREHTGIAYCAGFPLLAALLGRPCMIYAAEVGVLHSEAARQLTRAAFEQASVATVGDAASRDRLRAIGLVDVAVTADDAALAVGLLDDPRRRAGAVPDAAWLRAFAMRQTRRLAEHAARADELSARAEAQQLATVSAQADALAAEVARFRGSAVWQVAEALRHMSRRLAPPGSRRDRTVRAAVGTAVTMAQHGIVTTVKAACRRAPRTLRAWLLKPRGVWALDTRQDGDPTVTLYTDRDGLFKDHRPRRPLSGFRARRVAVSLVATARNERASVSSWLASVAAQTRVPDEVVVVDAGSTDGTAEALEAEAVRLGLDLKVLIEPGANIARGRNLAIERARGDVLAATDLGGRLTPTWLERIVAPFEADPATEVAAGWYVAMERGRPRPRRRWPTLDQVDPARFVPSSRSVAFTREAWVAAGGYPEWLTLTGEDTWFALDLRRFCARWAFVPEAVVEWDAPPTMTEYWRKIHAWSIGDGESGVGAPLYWRSFRRVAAVAALGAVGATGVAVTAAALGAAWALGLLVAFSVAGAAAVARRRSSLGSLGAIAWEVGGETARAIGFLRGAARRPVVTARRHREVRGVVLVLSGVPIDDTGGGARCTQLALEFLKQHWYVVFVNRFPRYESAELGLRIRHPRLFTVAFGDFAWRRFLHDHAVVLRERPVLTIVEFPLAEFVPLLRSVRRAGGSVVYDLLDDWDSTLGRAWYWPPVERKVIAQSEVLIATATPLAERLARMSGREVTLLPNAVNVDVFDPERSWPRPSDYPPAPWTMIYVGALWGDWFDWALVHRLAAVYAEAAIVMVGDYRNQMLRAPANVHFLGLKPQTALPAYLAHADVAILPWKVSAVTHATSPLKVYEYLAMRRPVVAPRLDALAGIPGVLLSNDAGAFVRNVDRARGTRLDPSTVDAFVRDNAWPARLATLLALTARAKGKAAGPRGDHGKLPLRDDGSDG